MKPSQNYSDVLICAIAGRNAASASQKTIKERMISLEQNEFRSQHDWRQIIHELILQVHLSGLPPPEEEILEKIEAEEASCTRSDE